MEQNTQSPLVKALEKALEEHNASGEPTSSATVRVGPHPDTLNAGDKNGDNK